VKSSDPSGSSLCVHRQMNSSSDSSLTPTFNRQSSAPRAGARQGKRRRNRRHDRLDNYCGLVAAHEQGSEVSRLSETLRLFLGSFALPPRHAISRDITCSVNPRWKTAVGDQGCLNYRVIVAFFRAPPPLHPNGLTTHPAWGAEAGLHFRRAGEFGAAKMSADWAAPVSRKLTSCPSPRQFSNAISWG
jgi:hypothetical protein